MDERDSTPAPRMVWMRLVLGSGHPIAIIVVVLALVGAGICWFSWEKISSLTKIPTRYSMEVTLLTEGCVDREFQLLGDIGSFGPSFLEFWFQDPDEQAVWAGECRLRSIRLTSNLPLTPMHIPASPEGTPADQVAPARDQLILVRGADVEGFLGYEGDHEDRWKEHIRIFQATMVDGALSAIGGLDEEAGPDFSMSIEEVDFRTGVPEQRIHHDVVFPDDWQPLLASFSFMVPENVKTYFDIYARQQVPRKPEEVEAGLWPWVYPAIDVLVSFRTDDVSVVRGTMLDSGEAKSIDGFMRFGIENNDAESRRESGNVTYSAVLGIGIALLVEAFVIVLAVVVRRLISRPAVATESESH